jgi:hypothetical protein
MGFTSDSTVMATFDGAPIVLSGLVVDSLGHFSATFAIPSSYSPGNYLVIVTDNASYSASTSFTLIASPLSSWPMFMHDLFLLWILHLQFQEA